MKLDIRIEQSRVRVRSGLKLIAILILIIVTTLLLGVIWLAKLASAVTVFFILVTLLEYWNVLRLLRQR